MGQPHADNLARSTLPHEPSLLDEQGKEPAFQESLLALGRVDRLGRKGVSALVSVYGEDLGHVWGEPFERLHAILREQNIPSSEAIAKDICANAHKHLEKGEDELRQLTSDRISVVSPAKIPPKLKSIPQPPQWLFVQGDVSVLYRAPAVAVVGTRQPSERGRRATRVVVKQLSAYPITVISGLAEGIDEEARRTALQESVKKVAFLGHGINVYFPAATKSLRLRLVQDGGAVVSEYLPDEHYKKNYFVQRNRLQAGLADLVIPVEAQPKGGTAHTVRFARTLDRQLAGVRWDRANGILAELERGNYPIYDIMTTEGKRSLDERFRELARQYNHKTSALAPIERALQREMQSRVVQRTDLEDLHERIVELLDDDFDEEVDEDADD